MLDQNMTNNIYVNKALELYHKYCPVNSNYPDQIHTITKALQLDNSSLVAIILYINRQHDFNLAKHKHHFNNNIIYLVDVINKLSTTHDKPYAEQYIHFNKLLLTINAKLQEKAVLTSLVPLLYKVSILNLEYNSTDAQHISEIITNCYIPYLLSYTIHNELAYLLQDLCFKIQHPEERNKILHYMHWLYPDIDNIIHNIDTQFRNIFRKLNIKANLSYRIKSPYSIWIKTLVKDIHITALNDILAFRAIVPNKKACYDVSKLIHLHYNTITSQFVDYIRYPKNNGYQSIHIVISGSNKGNIELQIRSTTMHRQTQYGSAHHTYKANKYYVSRTNNNVSVILYNITLSYSNRILNVDISIVTITSQIINNVSAYNTFAAFTNTQHSTHFVVNNTTTCTLSRTTTPEYITYYNNFLLLIKDTNTIPYNLSLNINLNLCNILEYKLVPPLAVAQISSNNISLEHNSGYVLDVVIKLLLSECAFPTNITYTTKHADSNIRSIFRPPPAKTDVMPKTYNTSFAIINNKVDIEKYAQKEIMSYTNTYNTRHLLELLIAPELLRHNISYISDHNKNILLYHAPNFDNSELVPFLIEHGADVNAKTTNNATVLHSASESGNISLVDWLVTNGAEVDVKDNHHNNALYYAYISGNFSLIQLLVEHGADVNAKINDNHTILHYAAISDNFSLVQFLVKHGADVNAKTTNNATVLHYAVESDNLALVQFLVKHGADVNAKTTNNATLLHYAAGSDNFDLIRYLVQCGIDINAKTTNNATILHYAAIDNNLDLINWLFQNWESENDIYLRTHNTEIALYCAAECGSLDLVRYLVQYGADVNAKTDSGETVLHFAVQSGNVDLVYWLIEQGADINAKTTNNATLLHYAAGSDNFDLIYLLIVRGADVNAKTDSGETVLHFAVQSGNVDLVYWLIKQGADINAKTTNNETILHYAVISEDYNLIYWLIKQGADINAKTTNNETVLYYAVICGNDNLVDWLIQQGADVNAKTTDNKTLLHYALEYKYFNIVKILIQCGIDLESATYNSMCHNDVFNYIKYTNTIPKQSTFEDIQTCQVQQYKRNTSANLKTDEILNPAPKSLDIHKNSNNFSSNTPMDITFQSSDQIEYNNYWGQNKLNTISQLISLTHSASGPLHLISYENIINVIYYLNLIFQNKSDEQNIHMLQCLSTKYHIDLDLSFSRPEILNVALSYADLCQDDVKQTQYKKTIDIILQVAKVAKTLKIISDFTNDHNNLNNISHEAIDYILELYHNTSEWDRITKAMPCNDIIKCPKETLKTLHNKITETFPKLSKICKEVITKDNLDTSEKTITDLPPEIQQHIFSYLVLKDIAMPDEDMINNAESVEVIGNCS